MPKPTVTLRTFIPRRAQRALESVLRALSLYVVPLGIAILSLVALVAWDSHYTVRDDKALQMRVLAEGLRSEARREGIACTADCRSRSSPDN